jgi:hypothetical protein
LPSPARAQRYSRELVHWSHGRCHRYFHQKLRPQRTPRYVRIQDGTHC